MVTKIEKQYTNIGGEGVVTILYPINFGKRQGIIMIVVDFGRIVRVGRVGGIPTDIIYFVHSKYYTNI